MIKSIRSVVFAFLFFIVPFAFGNSTGERDFYHLVSSLPRFSLQDKDEPQDLRDDRLEKFSNTAYKASKNKPPEISRVQMLAILLELAYAETKLAMNVGIGRCDLMPKGQQCDKGKAKTYYQLWEVACPAVWDKALEPGSEEELEIAANCAARLFKSAYARCKGKNKYGDIAGAFAGYRSTDCLWEPDKNGPKSRSENVNKYTYIMSKSR